MTSNEGGLGQGTILIEIPHGGPRETRQVSGFLNNTYPSREKYKDRRRSIKVGNHKIIGGQPLLNT